MMPWETRKHFDSEARKHVGESITDEVLLKKVMLAYESSFDAVERQEAAIQAAYADVARQLDQASALTGISQIRLLTIARRIASTSRDAEWYQVLDTVVRFYRINASLEEEEQS